MILTLTKIHPTFLLIILSLFTFQSTNAKLYFHSPPELAGLETIAWQFMFIGDKEKLNITSGRLIASDPIDGCDWDKIKNKDMFENNIVLFHLAHGSSACSPATKYKNAQRAKAQAAIHLAGYDQFTPMAASYYLDGKGVHLRAVECQADVPDNKGADLIVKYAKNDSVYVNVTLIAEDPHIYTAYYIAFSIITGIFSLINTGLGGWKLQQFIHLRGFELSLPQVCLILEMTSNFLRVILCIEPDSGVGRGLIDFGTVTFLQSGSLPWSFAATLMIAFYWDKSLRSFGKSQGVNWKVFSAEKWKIPLIIICVGMEILNLIGSTVIALYYAVRIIAVAIFIYFAICALCIGIFFSISGIKVLRWANRQRGNVPPRKTRKLSRLSVFVFLNAFGLFWIIICLIIMSLSVSGWLYGYIPIFIGLNFVSLVQILMFKASPPGGSSTDGSEKVKSNSYHTELSGRSINSSNDPLVEYSGSTTNTSI